jgi:hypothetical protein
MHVFFTLQDASERKWSYNIIYLYGGFQTRPGEQKLVLGEASNAKFSTFQYYHSSV